jgi:hypothetical protein
MGGFFICLKIKLVPPRKEIQNEFTKERTGGA